MAWRGVGVVTIEKREPLRRGTRRKELHRRTELAMRGPGGRADDSFFGRETTSEEVRVRGKGCPEGRELLFGRGRSTKGGV